MKKMEFGIGLIVWKIKSYYERFRRGRKIFYIFGWLEYFRLLFDDSFLDIIVLVERKSLERLLRIYFFKVFLGLGKDSNEVRY